MGASAKGLLRNIWQPQLQFVRFRGKVNITKPRPPHFKRAIMESVCVPYFQEKPWPKHIPNYDTCDNGLNDTKDEQDHPLELILAKEALNWFKNSKMIAFFHMNSMTPDEKFQNQLTLKKSGMKLFIFNYKILEKALQGTVYESLIQMYKGPTVTAFSPEINIASLLEVSKKLPKLILIAGTVENRLLSLSELKNFGRFLNITQAQSSLLTTLNVASQGVVRQINHHPSNLVRLLGEYENILKNGGGKG